MLLFSMQREMHGLSKRESRGHRASHFWNELELLEGRAWFVTCDAREPNRRTGRGESVGDVLCDLVTAGVLRSHPAALVFGERHPGVVLRARRTDVVFTMEAAGFLWPRDSWLGTACIHQPFAARNRMDPQLVGALL